jgi:hypothetical protein
VVQILRGWLRGFGARRIGATADDDVGAESPTFSQLRNHCKSRFTMPTRNNATATAQGTGYLENRLRNARRAA